MTLADLAKPLRRSAIATGFILLTLAGRSNAAQVWRWRQSDIKAIRALGKRITKADGRYRVETTHWVVESDVSPLFTAELARFLDLMAMTVAELFKSLPEASASAPKPIAVVFQDKADYTALFPDGTRGQYRYRFKNAKELGELRLYSFVSSSAEEKFSGFYRPILMHEGVHLLLRRRLGTAPIAKCLDEGVATYFQFWDVRGSISMNLKSRYSRSSFRASLATAVRQGLPPLADFLAVTDWNPDHMGPKATRNYAMAESLIDCLFATQRGRVFFKMVFGRVLDSQTPLLDDSEMKALERYWHRHARAVSR